MGCLKGIKPETLAMAFEDHIARVEEGPDRLVLGDTVIIGIRGSGVELTIRCSEDEGCEVMARLNDAPAVYCRMKGCMVDPLAMDKKRAEALLVMVERFLRAIGVGLLKCKKRSSPV